LAIGTSRKDDLCNDLSQDGVIVCHSSSTLYMMLYITFLQALRHNFCNAGNENGIGRSPDQFFPCGEKWSGNETKSGLHMKQPFPHGQSSQKFP